MYELIGRAVATYAWRHVRSRVPVRLIALGGLGLIAAGIAGYLATRDLPEG